MIPGIISLLLLCMGFMNAEPDMFIAAGLFAVASEMGWCIFHVRRTFRLVGGVKRPSDKTGGDKEW